MGPLLWLALGGAGAWYLYRMSKAAQTPAAQAGVGDLVFVPVTAGTIAYPGVPTTAGQVVVQVTGAQGDVLTGPIVGYALAGAPAVGYAQIPPTLPVTVNRASVTGVIHGPPPAAVQPVPVTPVAVTPPVAMTPPVAVAPRPPVATPMPHVAPRPVPLQTIRR
jgi:hypothetical protein